jgi:outer membrane protein TolC
MNTTMTARTRRRVRGRAALVSAALSLIAPVPGARSQEVASNPLSLQEAVAEALAGNAELRMAASRADMADAAAGGASAVYWPRVDFESGFTRSNDPVFAFGTKLRQGTFGADDFGIDALNDPDPVNDWVNRVTLQWKIFSPADWTARGAASLQAESARWNEVRIREVTSLRTEMLYREAQRAGAQLEAALKAEEAATANRDAFARRVEEGVLTRADLLQAEAEHASALARRVQAERLEEESRRNLAVYLGRGGESLPILADTLKVERVGRGESTTVAPEGFEPMDRADLRALSAARHAAAAESKRAGRSYLPEVGVFANYGIHAAEAFQNDGDDWMFGVGLKWNIFSGFGRAKDKQRADAARDMAEIRYDKAVREARAELETARSAVGAAERAVQATILATDAADAGAELMQRRFEEGLATASDLLQAEYRRADAESRAIDARATLYMAEARLRFVTTLHSEENDR